MTHDDLVQAAADWLLAGAKIPHGTDGRRTMKCSVVITDMTTAASETPDAIGWSSWTSVLLEAKASRSDFLRDRKKMYRRHPFMGMGQYRYYIAPKAMIRPEELPAGWGLVEVSGGRLRTKVLATKQEHNRNNEITMLVSALRRLPAEIDGVSCNWYSSRERGAKKRATIYVEDGPQGGGGGMRRDLKKMAEDHDSVVCEPVVAKCSYIKVRVPPGTTQADVDMMVRGVESATSGLHDDYCDGEEEEP
jgi:hypothetical protein